MQNSDLSIVDVFSPPYEHWSQRAATPEERHRHYVEHGWLPHKVDDHRVSVIRTPAEAARHMVLAGSDRRFEIFVEAHLKKSDAFKQWRRMMPPRTPPAISRYQKSFPDCDHGAVDFELKLYGVPLPKGQMVFHGGLWPGGSNHRYTTTKPLSTTLCPSVALRNAEHRGKAYDSGKIHLLVLRVDSPSIKAFVFRQKGTRLGHECEVLFPSGVTLERRSLEVVRDDYPACKWGFPEVVIPGSVVEADIICR